VGSRVKLDGTDKLVLGVIGGVLALDGVLAAKHRRLITDVLRANKRWYFLGVGVLSAHVMDWLGPIDPFELAGRVLDVFVGPPAAVGAAERAAMRRHERWRRAHLSKA
jgi:hypothetical protein